MKTSLYRTCNIKVTLAFQKHFENTRKTGVGGPLRLSLKSAYDLAAGNVPFVLIQLYDFRCFEMSPSNPRTMKACGFPNRVCNWLSKQKINKLNNAPSVWNNMSYRIRERIQIQVWKRYRTTPHNEPGTLVTLHAFWSLETNVFDGLSLQTKNREKVT